MLLLLKTARAEGKPPTLFIGGVGMLARVDRECIGGTWFDTPIPQSEYTELDLALSAGYQYYLDSLCGKCGTPLWYARSTHSAIEFEVEHSVCHACAELDRERERNHDGPKPGDTPYVVVTTTEYADGTKEELPDPLEALALVE